MRVKDFPGADDQTNRKFAKDVLDQEKAIVEAIRCVRQKEEVSLEEIGFLMGVGAGQISRFLSGSYSTTLANYLRIARALGYRFRVELERIEETDRESVSSPDLKIASHRVLHTRAKPLK